MTSNGQDAFGKFTSITGKVQCEVCKKQALGLRYTQTLKLPTGIKLADTILKSPANIIGVTCGCYAKFHRQVAHIEDKMKTRSSGH